MNERQFKAVHLFQLGAYMLNTIQNCTALLWIGDWDECFTNWVWLFWNDASTLGFPVS